jgi:heterodisulfide reductase subunit A
MRTAFKDYDEFYQKVLVRRRSLYPGRAAEVTDAARQPGEEGKLIVQAEDTCIGKQRRIPVDMVMLSPAWNRATTPKRTAHKFRHLLQLQRLVHRKTPQTGPGGHDDRRHLHCRRVPGAKGYPGQRRARAAAAARVLGRIQQRANCRWNRCGPASSKRNAPAAASATTMCPFNAISSTKI